MVWGFPFIIVFVHVAYGQLQILYSVGLSVFNYFCSSDMVDYRFLPSVGLAPAHPNQICELSSVFKRSP